MSFWVSAARGVGCGVRVVAVFAIEVVVDVAVIVLVAIGHGTVDVLGITSGQRVHSFL